MRFFVCFLIFLSTLNGFSQEKDSLVLARKNGISKPSILSTHPFGIFISRIQGNFKNFPVKNTTIRLNLESGNVWGTPITTYIPNDESIRDLVREHTWHQAQYHFDEEALDAQSFELQIDGVIKGFRGSVEFKLGEEHELSLGIRSFLLTKGKYPFSFFTNDEFIEYFHSNIGGGDDPFDRSVFGLNQAYIRYVDRNNRTMEISNGDLLFGGFETSYYYYPKALINKKGNLFFNFGAHLGTNLSRYNSSIDLGLSFNGIKSIGINQKSNFQIGFSIGTINKSIIDLKDENMDFGTNSFITFLETALEYNFVSKKGKIHSIGADFYIQTPLNKVAERDYMIPVRHPNAHNSWGHGVTNLYEYNDYWSFMYSITKKNTLTLYLQQDFTVSNNPDIQTGICYSFEL